MKRYNYLPFILNILDHVRHRFFHSWDLRKKKKPHVNQVNQVLGKIFNDSNSQHQQLFRAIGHPGANAGLSMSIRGIYMVNREVSSACAIQIYDARNFLKKLTKKLLTIQHFIELPLLGASCRLYVKVTFDAAFFECAICKNPNSRVLALNS